jgi:uncharacterized membrane protein
VEDGVAAAAEAAVGVADFLVEAGVLEAAARAAVGNMKTKEFIAALDDNQVAAAIERAEQKTSGEIRVFVTEQPVADVVTEAGKQFVRLGMTNTKQRNGVLIYFAPVSQKFAVMGDEGVHQRCGAEFWQHITAEMTPLLKAARYTEAIVLAVKEVGETLAREFPWESGDRNELPNKIARDEPTHE